MNSPMLSIIVPIYNIERDLKRCLNSILNQSYTNYECILVNDGSTDRSGDICDEYSKRDKRFIVLHQDNGGLSVARNNALKKVKGEYVAFIDGDDYIMPSYCETMMALLVDNNVDVVKCDYFPGELSEKVKIPTILSQDGRKFTEELLEDNIGSQLWQYIFKKDLWKGIISPEGRYAQDMMVLHEVTNKAKNIIITNEKLYFYYIDRSDSTSNSSTKKIKGAFDRAIAFKIRYDFAHEYGYEECSNSLMKKVLDFYNNAMTLKKSGDRKYNQDIHTLSQFLRKYKSR